jgi:hypothetical protein
MRIGGCYMTRFVVTLLIIIATGCLAHADAFDLLKAGLEARNRGDFGAAAKFYTEAIDTGRLSGGDLAIVLTSRGVPLMCPTT